MPRGFVIGVTGPRFLVSVDGRLVSCVLRGRLKKERQAPTSLVVVGDDVEVSLGGDGTGAIEAVGPRRTELARPGRAGRTRLVAANLDLLVVVQATRLPAFNRHTVERFLALAERGGLSGLLVVNKSDLEAPERVEAWVAPLRENGVRAIATSAVSGKGIEELRAALAGRLSAMVGPSGVGKSSLVNALDPGLLARTGAVSTSTRRGRHTTTASRLYALAGGGYLADTPGIRELGLFEDDAASVRTVFPEIEEAAFLCRFRGCSHSHEPGCAVKELVESGAIERDRYRHFLRLQAGG